MIACVRLLKDSIEWLSFYEILKKYFGAEIDLLNLRFKANYITSQSQQKPFFCLLRDQHEQKFLPHHAIPIDLSETTLIALFKGISEISLKFKDVIA